MNLNGKIYVFKGIWTYLLYYFKKYSPQYLFLGEKYWVYDPANEHPVSHEYPRPLRDWKSVPANVDAVFSSNDDIITFVKDNFYYTFNTKTLSVSKNFYLIDLSLLYQCQ